MTRRIWGRGMILALLATAFLAPQAAAATPEMTPVSGGFPVSVLGFFGGGNLTTVGGSSITCINGAGGGQITSKTTGEGSYTLGGCKSSSFSCTSPGQSTGTIKIQTMTMDLVYLDAAHTNPGVLAKPPAGGVFSEFTCAFVKVVVTGNGVLGKVTSPKCGATSGTASVSLEAAGTGVQKYKQVEEAGTVYNLIATVGGTPEEAALTLGISGTAEREGTLTCPK
jgi:hypothetical protein